MSTDYFAKFNSALELAEKGSIDQSLQLFEELQLKNGTDYCSVVNIGVLYLQERKMSPALVALERAIKIDRYQYLAYYNLFILYYQQLQNKRILSKSLPKQEQNRIINKIYHYLHLTFSCAYAYLAEVQKDSKLCTKALNFCQQNSAAYAYRAQIYELDHKLKLAENDYSSAIYYDPQSPIFYMRRAEFYWRNNRFEEANKDIKTYWHMKNLQHHNQLDHLKLLSSKQVTQIQIEYFDDKILQKSIQLQNLFDKIRESNKKQEQKIDIKKIPSIQQELQQKISSKKNDEENKEVFIDESSKNISQQIEKLENQIRLQGGKLSESQSKDKEMSNEETFLTQEIEKTTKQIEHIKQLSSLKSPRQSQTSVTSKYSQKVISVDEIANYEKIVLQIVSAQFFDANNKQESKIYITYGNQKKQTDFSKTNVWRHKFSFNIDLNLHKKYKSGLDSDEEREEQDHVKQTEGQILLELQMRSGSIFSSKKIIGKGYINIQHLGENKCILSNEREKSGIIYFKLKLQ